MYTDKSKQREAVREATRRYRLKKGITKVSPEVSDTPKVVIPKAMKTADDVPKPLYNSRGWDLHHPTCGCYRCKPPKDK